MNARPTETTRLIPSPIRHWVHRIVLGMVLLTAVGLRLYRLGYPSLWIDEIGQVLVSGLPFPQFWQGVERHHGAAPLDYLVTKAMLLSGAHSDFMLRLPAVLWGVLAVYWTYRVGRRLFSCEAGLLAAALLALNPMHLVYSQELRFYALFIFLTLLSTEIFLQAWEKDQWRWWFFYATAVLLMLYSHYYGSLVLALHGARGIFERFWPDVPHSKAWRSRFFHFLIAAGAASMLFLPWVIYDLPREKGFVGAAPPDLTIDLIQSVLREMTGLPWGAWAASLLALSGVVVLFRKRKSAALVLGFWLISLLPVALWIDHHNVYFFHARQIIFGLPFLLILVAGGLDALLKLLADGIQRLLGKRQGRWTHSGLILIVLIAMISAYYPKLSDHYRFQDGREDWKGASELLVRNRTASDVLVFPSSADRYYMKHYLSADVWEKTFVVAHESELREIVSGGSPVWVLVSPYTASVNPEMKDVEQWLAEMGGIPFAFNQRFKLYFLWPGQDEEAVKARARKWSAPERLHWWMVVGGAMRAANVHGAALKAYRHAAELPDFSSKRADAFVQAGVEALAVGDAELALELLDQALSLDDSNNQARLHQARALLKLNRADDALTILNEVQRRKGPNDYWLQFLKGKAYESLAQWDSAIESYQKALSLKPDANQLCFFIARVYQQMGNAEQAGEWYQAYLNRAPEGPFALQAQEFLQTETSP